MLLHATASVENWAFVKIPVRDSILHLLRAPERCSAGVRSSRVVFQGMEVPRGAETVVQASWAFGWIGKLVERVAAVLVL